MPEGWRTNPGSAEKSYPLYRFEQNTDCSADQL